MAHLYTDCESRVHKKKGGFCAYSAYNTFTPPPPPSPSSSYFLQSALQPLVGFGLLYDFVPQSSIFTLLSPVSHFCLL